jgi:hypothetical protein
VGVGVGVGIRVRALSVEVLDIKCMHAEHPLLMHNCDWIILVSLYVFWSWCLCRCIVRGGCNIK